MDLGIYHQANFLPRVDPVLCHACQQCKARRLCPVGALVQIDTGEPPFVDNARCYGCRSCLSACPFGAIRITSP
jgi:electron transport protein HydN